MPKKLALLKQKMKKNCIPSAKNKKDLHSQCQIKKNLHSQYQKLKNIVVFEKFGHVTYLQICKFKNLQIYDVLNALDICFAISSLKRKFKISQIFAIHLRNLV